MSRDIAASVRITRYVPYLKKIRGNLEKPIDSNNLRFGENILATATATNDATRNTGVPNQNQPPIRPPFDIHLENFEYVSSKYSLDEICACLELRTVFKIIFFLIMSPYGTQYPKVDKPTVHV